MKTHHILGLAILAMIAVGAFGYESMHAKPAHAAPAHASAGKPCDIRPC